MQEGHKGANPYAGQREATTITDDRSMNTDNPTTLTKLDMYNILVEKARTHGEKNRPPDLEINERTLSVLNALYPDGIPNNIDIECKTLQDKISKFISKCEKLYKQSSRNIQRFSKKKRKTVSNNF